MFTDNLSKMVAYYKNYVRKFVLRLTLNEALDIYTICNNIVDISGLERNVINMMDKTYWQKKP